MDTPQLVSLLMAQVMLKQGDAFVNMDDLYKALETRGLKQQLPFWSRSRD
jgi:hypothetical protein